MKRETDDQRAERLLVLGLALVGSVREEDPADYVRPLRRLDRGELEHLAVLLAACVPDHARVSELLGWWTGPAPVTPPDVGVLLAERFGLPVGAAVR